MDGEAQTTQMPQERDDDSGQYQEVYPLETVEQAVRAVGQGTTQDVADELGCAYQTAYMKLRQLEDDDDSPVKSGRVGNVRVWAVEDETDE
jgi:hypothetical protein